MANSQNKTQPTNQDVLSFLAAVPDEVKRQDGEELIRIMTEISGEQPRMWGPTIIGFGQYHYKYPSGREGDAPLMAFSPRKSSLVIYLVEDFSNDRSLLDKLGPHQTSKSCLYIKRLSDIDINILQQLIQKSYNETLKQYSEV